MEVDQEEAGSSGSIQLHLKPPSSPTRPKLEVKTDSVGEVGEGKAICMCGGAPTSSRPLASMTEITELPSYK
jgi:hypothetical protein